MGRASMLRKRSAHITVVVTDEKKKKKATPAKKAKTEAPKAEAKPDAKKAKAPKTKDLNAKTTKSKSQKRS
jgi:hypothetical protein